MSDEARVYLVGAGPGDPDLLTVKAVRLLQSAEVVVLDRLISPGIRDLIPQGTSCIYAGKAPGKHYVSQDEINAMLVKLARAGRRVVRLKGGDPFIFGRGGEEALYLARHGIGVEVVPGVSAAAGCGAMFNIPLTHRGAATSVRFVTGHCRDNGELQLDWRGLADPDTTLVIYMGLGTIGEIAARLMEAGLDSATPAAAVEKGTTGEQRCHATTLARLPRMVEEQGFAPPTLLIIGRVIDVAAAMDLRGLIRPDQPDVPAVAVGEGLSAHG